MPESGTYGSVRGALSNGRPYRDLSPPKDRHNRPPVRSVGTAQGRAFAHPTETYDDAILTSKVAPSSAILKFESYRATTLRPRGERRSRSGELSEFMLGGSAKAARSLAPRAGRGLG
jgi:hypothetical protein